MGKPAATDSPRLTPLSHSFTLDLAFSGDRRFERGIERFSTHVAAILLEEGFHVHHRKTRVMRQGVR